MTAKKLVINKKRCIVCSHPDRALIEAAKISGASIDVIGKKFKVSRDCVWRHMKSHVSDDMRAEYLAAVPMTELAERAATEGVSVLQYFSIIRGVLMQQFQMASSLNDRNGTAILAGRLTEVLRAIGSISGEMGSLAANSITINGNVNVLNSPAFASLQASMLQALAPYPEARAAVVMALRAMDDESAPMKIVEQIPLAESATKVIEHVSTAVSRQ